MDKIISCQKKKFKSFDEELKVNFKKRDLESERKNFINYIINNIDVLATFSDNQLLKLIRYIEDENERKRKLLNGFNN